MRFISTKTHGYLDYLTGALLVAAPFLLDFDRGGAETWVPVLLGIGTILYSLMTRYELGAMKVIPMPAHLTIDLVAGIFLAASPWIFGFAEYVWLPHLLVGVFEITASLLTEREPHPIVSESHR